MSAASGEVRSLRAGEETLWDELVRESSPVPFFASREWVDAVARAYGGRAHVIGAFRGGRLEGGAALPVRTRMGLRVATAPYLLPYMPLLVRGPRAQTVRDLLGYAARRFPIVSILGTPEEKDMRPYRAAGWDLAYRYSLRFDLRDVTIEGLLAQMEKPQRRKVRRAEEEGFEVRIASDPAAHCGLVLGSYARQGKPFPLPEAEETRLIRWAVESGRARVYELAREGRVAATLLVGIDGMRAYSLESGVDWESGRGGESPYLIARVLASLASEGVPEFDFLGVNHPTISRFKESFGGRLVRYHAAAPPRPFWVRAILRLRRVPSTLEVSGEGSVSR